MVTANGTRHFRAICASAPGLKARQTLAMNYGRPLLKLGDFAEAIRVVKSRCKTDAEREALQRKIEAGEPLHEILRELAPEHLSFEEFD